MPAVILMNAEAMLCLNRLEHLLRKEKCQLTMRRATYELIMKTNKVHPPLDLSRGNPNWTATLPREAFFRLGLFGIQECKRVRCHDYGICGTPEKKGIAKRFETFMKEVRVLSGSELLWETYRYGVEQHDFNPDEWVYELTSGVIGEHYPSPVRILKHVEVIVHDYLMQELCQRKVHYTQTHDLFATEGSTAAICYVFDSLMNSGLLRKGDTIALGVPAFGPYLEMPAMERYQFNVVHIHASERDTSGNATFQYSTTELDKLKDHSVKCFFVTNPSNPMSVAIDRLGLHYLTELVKRYNSSLMIISDDAYGNFVPAFHSLLRELPYNTLCIYSFSKYFGATGWRLGVIALHRENVFDRKSVQQSESRDQLKFIDRLAADSRQVALNDTAGLSLPQQIQMLLFASFSLLDRENKYKRICMNTVRTRYNLFWKGLHLPITPDPNRAAYYCEFNVLEWAKRYHGQEFADYLISQFEPADILLRLAEEEGVELLNGEHLVVPEWSVRISMAHLDNDKSEAVGLALLHILADYVFMWKSTKK